MSYHIHVATRRAHMYTHIVQPIKEHDLTLTAHVLSHLYPTMCRLPCTTHTRITHAYAQRVRIMCTMGARSPALTGCTFPRPYLTVYMFPCIAHTCIIRAYTHHVHNGGTRYSPYSTCIATSIPHHTYVTVHSTYADMYTAYIQYGYVI